MQSKIADGETAFDYKSEGVPDLINQLAQGLDDDGSDFENDETNAEIFKGCKRDPLSSNRKRRTLTSR